MAISVFGPFDGGTTATTTQSTFTIVVGSVSVGDTIVLGIGSGNAAISTVVDGLGNTFVPIIVNSFFQNEASYWCTVTTGGSMTITVTAAANSNMCGTAYRLTGMALRPLDLFTSTHSVTGSPSVTFPQSTDHANEIVFFFTSVFFGSGTDPLTAGAGYTAHNNNNTPTSGQTLTLGSEYQIISSKQTPAPGGTLGSSASTDYWGFSLKAIDAAVPFADDYAALDLTFRWPGEGSNGSYNTARFSSVGGQLQLAQPGATANYGGIITGQSAPFNLTGNRLSIQVVSIGTSSSNPSTEINPLQTYQDAGPANNLAWYVNSGNLSAFKKVASSLTFVASLGAFSPTTHKYLSIRESGGTIFWEYSADGITWTNAHSEANPFAVTAMVVELTIGAFAATDGAVTVLLDNFNILPASFVPAMALMGVG